MGKRKRKVGRHRIYHGDCIEVLKSFKANYFDSCVTDPPYGLEFMGKEWDAADGFRRSLNKNDVGRGNVFGRTSSKAPEYRTAGVGKKSKPGIGKRDTEWPSNQGWNKYRCAKCGHLFHGGSPCGCDEPEPIVADNRWNLFQEWCLAWATELYRVMKPGAYIVVFGGTRTWHRMACAVEDAGFEIRDTISWLYGCLSDDTEILVDGGWVHYTKATKGRLALGYDPDRDAFSWQPIQETFAYDYSDTAYRVRSDHTDQIVSRNHRCLVERGGKYVFQVAEEAARELHQNVPVLEDLRGLLETLPVPQQSPGRQKSKVRLDLRRSGEKASQKKAGKRKGRKGRSPLRKLPTPVLYVSVSRGPRSEAHLLSTVQRQTSCSGVGKAFSQGTGRLDRSESRELQAEDVGREQPGMERRGDVLPQARELQTDQVRQVSVGVPDDGPEGRLRHGTSADRCEGDREVPVTVGGGTSQEPRSAGQPQAEPDAVRLEPGSQTVRASRFARPDLARIEPVPYVGVVWCVRVPTGAFVARRNGKVFVTGNSGFPKSLDVAKAIDKKAGVWRGRAGEVSSANGATSGPNYERTDKGEPVTPEAKEWEGWGTALKPAFEPAVLARKPLIGTVSANVLKYGTGAINIDASRIHADDAKGGEYRVKRFAPGASVNIDGKWKQEQEFVGNQKPGRFPANVIHDGSEEVLAAFAKYGNKKSGSGQIKVSGGKKSGDGLWTPRGGMMSGGAENLGIRDFGDNGSAARFFYTAKASKREKGKDCRHPTVKPVKLGRYLIRLVTPKGGRIIDPFAGSGSFGVAAHKEMFTFYGIEQELESVDTAERRLSKLVESGLGLF